MRVIKQQTNPWGRNTGQGGGLDPQRSDLWLLDLASVADGIKNQLYVEMNVPAYFAQSVAIPELRVKAEQFRRDSRPFNMPSFDDPLDAVKVTFMLESTDGVRRSIIYSMLDAWRSLVRAGRGSMSSEFVPTLNSSFRIDFQFDVHLFLLKGAAGSISTASERESVAQATAALRRVNDQSFSIKSKAPAQNQNVPSIDASVMTDSDLTYSGLYTLKNCWLGGFKLSDFSYAQSQLTMIESTIYAEDVLDRSK